MKEPDAGPERLNQVLTAHGSRPSTGCLPAGYRLAHYEILEAIGAGGMGQVYRARDTRLHRDVALKTLPPALVADPARRERFVQEARAASALEHPHIAVIHEIGESDGVTYIAMELLRGESLDAVVNKRPLAPARALDLAVEIGEGLARAHETDIIHRDLKPANVMVTGDGHAKIIDFGLAKLVNALATDSDAATVAREPTEPGAMLGTPSYMSPEQACGGRVDSRSDVFSFGVMLHEMVTGRPPFRGRSAIETMHAILHDPTPKLPASIGPATADLQRIIDKSLAKEPCDRYQGMRDLVVDLRAARRRLESAQISGAAATLPMLQLLTQRSMRIAGAVVLISLVVAGITGWRVLLRARSERDRQAAIAEVEHLVDQGRFVDVWRIAQPALHRWPGEPKLEQMLHSTTDTITIATDPPGAAVAFKAYDDSLGPWIQFGTTPLTGVRAPLGMLRWRLTKSGFDPLEARLQVGAPAAAIGRPDVEAKPIRLRPINGDMAGMVFVPGGLEGGIQLADYWLDQMEVTNRTFKAFIDRGGYNNPTYWTSLDGGRDRARALFRDRTGQPGPATWELGTYPPGQDDYPVSGLSWFEAQAYCQAAGKTLPTVRHWRKAFGAVFFMEVVTLGNFDGRGPRSTGQLQDVGPYGTLGMAGNVKEWVWNEYQGERYILGGAWNEPVYMAMNDDVRPPLNRAQTNGVRCLKEVAPSPAGAYGPVAHSILDPAKLKPVDAATFAIFRRFYSYDETPLEAKIESRQESEQWRRERVSYVAAYGNERVIANILLPKNAAPPYQAVIWFPGSYALDLRNSEGDLPFSYYFDFVPRSGRALIYPVYKGTYERRMPLRGDSDYRDMVVAWSKDLGRTITYLGSRGDIAQDKIAYYGFSTGADEAVPVVALEPRLKAVIFLTGGLDNGKYLPEVAPVNFLPRITAPVLMLEGRYDFVFPVETSQKPFFRLLGTPPEHKKYVLFENAGHVPPRLDVIRESLTWLERYLGPVEHPPPR